MPCCPLRVEGELTVSQAVRCRHSHRAFQERPIEEEKLQLMLFAARWAASWGNRQPWRWIVVRDPAVRAALHQGLDPANHWATRAPVIFVVAAHPDDGGYKDGRPYYLLDCGQSIGQFLLQAAALGIMTHVMAGWTEPAIKEALAVPDPVRIVALIAAGYEGDRESLDETTRQKDLRPRSRKPAHETVSYDRWGSPAYNGPIEKMC